MNVKLSKFQRDAGDSCIWVGRGLKAAKVQKAATLLNYNINIKFRTSSIKSNNGLYGVSLHSLHDSYIDSNNHQVEVITSDFDWFRNSGNPGSSPGTTYFCRSVHLEDADDDPFDTPNLDWAAEHSQAWMGLLCHLAYFFLSSRGSTSYTHVELHSEWHSSRVSWLGVCW